MQVLSTYTEKKVLLGLHWMTIRMVKLENCHSQRLNAWDYRTLTTEGGNSNAGSDGWANLVRLPVVKIE